MKKIILVCIANNMRKKEEMINKHNNHRTDIHTLKRVSIIISLMRF